MKRLLEHGFYGLAFHMWRREPNQEAAGDAYIHRDKWLGRPFFFFFNSIVEEEGLNHDSSYKREYIMSLNYKTLNCENKFKRI